MNHQDILRLLSEEALSGRILRERLQQRLGTAPSLAQVYVLLHRLEAQGLLCAWWGKDAPPARGHLPRRYYGLTVRGLQTFHAAEHPDA